MHFLSRPDHSILRLVTCLLLALLLSQSPALVAAEEGVEMVVHPPGIDLPEGKGKDLLLAACTRCHDLKRLAAYKGYWNLPRWRSMVETMVKNGAVLDSMQISIVAAYLAENFGPAGEALQPPSTTTHQTC